MEQQAEISAEEAAMISGMVDHYRANQTILKLFFASVQTLLTDPENGLSKYVHSFKWRLKDPDHLRDKLCRKFAEAKKKNEQFEITKENLFVTVNDLVGARLLHLHTKQIASIDPILRRLFDEARFKLVEGPFARTWDDESKKFFEEHDIKTKESGPSMYTSVHYVIDSASSARCTAEIQVRTLAEELWGEVAHTIDYPRPTKSVACQEQIRVLARVTSSCTRLVDAIFTTHADFNSGAAAATQASPVAGDKADR